jgi:hypothetical protein
MQPTTPKRWPSHPANASASLLLVENTPLLVEVAKAAIRLNGAIAPKLEPAEIERAEGEPVESRDAYDYYLRGIAAFRAFSKASTRKHWRGVVTLSPVALVCLSR